MWRESIAASDESPRFRLVDQTLKFQELGVVAHHLSGGVPDSADCCNEQILLDA